MGGKVVREEGRYLRAEFREQGLPGQVDNFDDTEFFFTPNDSTVRNSATIRLLSRGPLPGQDDNLDVADICFTLNDSVMPELS